MTKYLATLDLTFQALADPTRRQVLKQLARGPASVSELAVSYEMALPSFMQHLKMLEKGGLVISSKQGRVRTYQRVPEQMQAANDWLSKQMQDWEQRLNQLDNFLLQLAQTETNKQIINEKKDDNKND